MDFLDPAGGYLLPVERMRRYVTPADINGTGSIRQYDGQHSKSGPNLAPTSGDAWNTTAISGPPACPGRCLRRPLQGAFPPRRLVPLAQLDQYRAVPDHGGVERAPPTGTTSSIVNDNNPLHGFEAFRFPNMNYVTGSFNAQSVGGIPVDLNKLPGNANLPGLLPTYDAQSNGRVNSDGLNEADEMNLYQHQRPARLAVRLGDLEWLYRVSRTSTALAHQPAVPARPGQLHQPDRRPAPAPAVRDGHLGHEQLRLGQRQPGRRLPLQLPASRRASDAGFAVHLA